MAGHSKWSNIKRKKEKTDSAKGKVFTKVAREIHVAVKAGGSNPDENSRLRDALDKAKSLNVPNDNIERAIKKASEVGGDDYEEMLYEGYGPSGTAVIVKALTDNRNRTAGDIRHYFDKHGGNLGQSGSVTFQFQQQGVIVIENTGISEDQIMEDALNAGGDDLEYDEEAIEITTTPQNLIAVRSALAKNGYVFASAEVEYLPITTVDLAQEDIMKMEKLLEMMEDNDDIQELWHNWNQPED